MTTSRGTTRRRALKGAAAMFGMTYAPGIVLAAGGRGIARPSVAWGSQVGDVRGDSAVIWSRTDRPARMLLRWATRPDMKDAIVAPFTTALEDSDFTTKILLDGLPEDVGVHYELQFLDLDNYQSLSETLTGSFRTPATNKTRSVRFVWSGDCAGQGWGINPDFGGMRIFDSMRQMGPDFFVHCGDAVYADNPLTEQVTLTDGRVWRNLVTPEKSKVAETLNEFRGQYRYNLMDEPYRRFNASVPIYAQWDDHDVTNNWYWEKRLDSDPRYTERSVAKLAARGIRAFQEYMPIRQHPREPGRIYDSFAYGPSLEVFRIDMRSYRSANRDEQPSQYTSESQLLGLNQIEWLKGALSRSKATWKVIASSMPVGVIVLDDWKTGRGAEAVALRDGPARGRELEIAGLLQFIRDQNIDNVVWLTADVHYTAAHYYDPSKAQFKEFSPFWEFISGPLNAGTFGPNSLDNTFGPQVVFQKAPTGNLSNLSPLDGMQFFGQVDIDGESQRMTVTLKDLDGHPLFTQTLHPVRKSSAIL